MRSGWEGAWALRKDKQQEGDGEERSTIASRTRRCCSGRGEDIEHRRGQRCRATKTVVSWCARECAPQRSTQSCSEDMFSERNRSEDGTICHQVLLQDCQQNRQERRSTKSKARNHQTMVKQPVLLCLNTENHVQVPETAR